MIPNLRNKKEIQGRIAAFFRSKGWKDTLVFLGFVMLASCFWGLQYIRQQFEFEVPMQIHYTHVPAGIALSDNPPKEISLNVQDKGSAYLSYLIGERRHSLSITVDLSSLSLSKNSYIIDQAGLRNLIDDKLLTSTQLKLFSPDRIEINYSPLAQKEVPVAINGTISPALGYMFTDSIRIEPSQVIVYGNKNELDTLRKIQTQPLDYKNISKDWAVSAGLQVPEGIRLSDNQVKISAKIEEYTEKTFQLPVICNNMPPNRNVRFFPSIVELAVKVGLSRYHQLSNPDFEIAVNYSGLISKNTANCSLTLTRKPPGVTSYRITPNVIEFLIEQKNN
jgi:hypothetical protein